VLCVIANGGSPDVTLSTNYHASTFIPGQNFLDLAVTADSGGKLDIIYNGAGLSPEGNLNGFQLVDASQAPEPAPMGLIAVGIAGLIWRRRRALALPTSTSAGA
jgi:hypothetical protein